MLIFGINGIGKEAGNESITNGRSTPWLQDELGVEAWDSWNVNYRDVYILNGSLEWVDQINLSKIDLTDENNYQEFRELLLSVD